MKRILIVGAKGNIGKAVAKDLAQDFKIISAGRTNADIILDVTDRASIDKALKGSDKFDGLITCYGKAAFGDFTDIDLAEDGNGLGYKFSGQVNMVQAVLPLLNDGASITLTSGILNDQPIAGGVFAAAANGALNSFTYALALELNGRARVNIVSPSLIADSQDALGGKFPGFEITPMQDVINAYRHCVMGQLNGKVLRLYRPI